MKKIAVITLGSAIALLALVSPLSAAPLTDQNKQFLTAYDKVHHALVADDLARAKAAAKDLGTDGNEVANASSLNDARAGFEKLSSRAKTLVAGQSDYHVVHCPMLKKDWVQTSTTIENPYGGKDMVTCGEIQK